MKNISEIFEEFNKAQTRQEKIDVLRKNSCPALRNVLKGTFDPTIEFTITNVPMYTPSDSPIGLGYSTIHQEIGRAYMFQKNNPRTAPSLSEERKEQILIQILEMLEAKEAQIFVNMLLKKQNVPELTSTIVKEAFPDLI